MQAATRDPNDLVRMLSAVLPPVLAPQAARPHCAGNNNRRGGEDDDYEEESAFAPLQRAWWALGGFH